MCCFFFFKDAATTEIYTLSLHDALPILIAGEGDGAGVAAVEEGDAAVLGVGHLAGGAEGVQIGRAHV